VLVMIEDPVKLHGSVAVPQFPDTMRLRSELLHPESANPVLAL
jgi:hypothetical protein